MRNSISKNLHESSRKFFCKRLCFKDNEGWFSLVKAVRRGVDGLFRFEPGDFEIQLHEEHRGGTKLPLDLNHKVFPDNLRMYVSLGPSARHSRVSLCPSILEADKFSK